MFPDRETVERLRREYPAGCRIVLDEQDDPYTRIPVGSQATCQGVDDAGNILCAWDCGSSLSIAWPVDRCHKVSSEEEAKTTLEWYGKHQPKENAMPALRRADGRPDTPPCAEPESRYLHFG